MRKQVYFAGSIRGGRSDAALYKQLIEYINQKGTVLTEHIGTISIEQSKHQSDTQIYEQDTAWIRQCDVLIAECTTASLGVGYELAYAEALGKPVHILYRPSRTNLSAMLSGNARFALHPYETPEEAFHVIDTIL